MGESGLVVMGGAMLGKSLIHFLLLGGLCAFPVVWPEAKHGRGQRASASTVVASAPTPWQATADPRLCWRLLDAHGKSGSVSCGSLLLSPGSWCTQGFVCALQESVSPVL